MNKAFVFGKFLPLHKGHEAMIKFALTKCDFLTVLICCSDKEIIPGIVRKEWVEASFKGQNVEVIIFEYAENEMPNTSVSSRTVSKVWSALFKRLFPDYSVVVTSEKYGDYVGEYMGIEHVKFDIPRRCVPISSTAIRDKLFDKWKFLPDSVKPYFVIKVAILGTESTGKTTLAEYLATYYKCSLVQEAARELIADSNSFSLADLKLVAAQHATEIERAVTGPSPLVIIDTDIHTTMSYARHFFDSKFENHKQYDLNKADLYLYLTPDVPHIQDGTRLDLTTRNQLDISHREILQEHNIPIVEISGSWRERQEKAIESIEQCIRK